nr:putative reverse transcriptase domain-containing protein [Tanacetum cinerariifolium]
MLRLTVVHTELSLVTFMHLSLSIMVLYRENLCRSFWLYKHVPYRSHGCEGFLATIHDTTSEVPSIHDQPIVSEFPDVFLDELPGIPPVREVKFNIELIPGSEPISKAPYCMAPVELKELKDQLQELLDQGFIRLSVS